MNWFSVLKYDTSNRGPLGPNYRKLNPQEKKREYTRKTEQFANSIADYLDKNQTVIETDVGIFDINNPQHLIRLARKGKFMEQRANEEEGLDLNKPENMNLFMIVMGQRGYN
jgi:hypothetical protein